MKLHVPRDLMDKKTFAEIQEKSKLITISADDDSDLPESVETNDHSTMPLRMNKAKSNFHYVNKPSNKTTNAAAAAEKSKARNKLVFNKNVSNLSASRRKNH